MTSFSGVILLDMYKTSAVIVFEPHGSERITEFGEETVKIQKCELKKSIDFPSDLIASN